MELEKQVCNLELAQKLTDGEGGHVVREAYMVVCKVVRFTIRFAYCVAAPIDGTDKLI